MTDEESLCIPGIERPVQFSRSVKGAKCTAFRP